MSRRGFTILEFAPRAGFQLVEVLIALVILAVGVVGLAGSTALVACQATLAELATERAAALESVVERLRATPYASLEAGSDSVGLFYVSWSTTGLTSSTMLEIVTVGPGLNIGSGEVSHLVGEVADTFSYRIVEPL